MLKARQKVNLTYYEEECQVERHGWIVQEYDNGLLKVRQPTPTIKEIVKCGPDGKVMSRTPIKRQATKPVIFNLRSVGFLKVELA
jgi:hypothetical protein